MYISPLLFILSIHLEQAMAETANTKHLHKVFQNPEAVLRIVFIWLTGTMFTKEAVGALVGALRSLPSRNTAEEPETLEVLRVPMSESAWAALVSLGVRSGVNELQRAVLESAGVRSGVDDLLSRPNGLVHA